MDDPVLSGLQKLVRNFDRRNMLTMAGACTQLADLAVAPHQLPWHPHSNVGRNNGETAMLTKAPDDLQQL
jgi:hypothetical protein